METPKVFESEYKFCLILWENEPIKSGNLVKLCKERLGWKSTTTYTVIKRLSERGAIAVDANFLNISLNAASNLVVAGKCKKLRTRTNGKGNALNLDSFLVESRE